MVNDVLHTLEAATEYIKRVSDRTVNTDEDHADYDLLEKMENAIGILHKYIAHTPEPWGYRKTINPYGDQFSGYTVHGSYNYLSDEIFFTPEGEVRDAGNAHRAVTCVNFLQGINTYTMEGNDTLQSILRRWYIKTTRIADPALCLEELTEEIDDLLS